MDSKNMRVCAYVDMDAFRHNMKSIESCISDDSQIIAVIKTNGYGHGSVSLGKVLEPMNRVWGYATATIEEAIELREAGLHKPVLILGYTFPDAYEAIALYDLRPAVFSYETAVEISKAAVKHGKTVNVHIKLDTGMSRIGFQVNDKSAEAIKDISELENIRIEGMFTHFSKADEYDKTFTENQVKLYDSMVNMLSERGVDIPFKHVSNSAGIVDLPQYNKNLVRAGIILYGLWPSDEVIFENIDLKPIMEIKSHIVHIKELEEGRRVSYGGTYTVEGVKRIATVPVGYGDGYPRQLSNKGYVLIKGKRAPICGRVCMDQFMVDITDIPEASLYDEVTLVGNDGVEKMTMEMLGDISGRFNYEFACCITKRVPRVYKNL